MRPRCPMVSSRGNTTSAPSATMNSVSSTPRCRFPGSLITSRWSISTRSTCVVAPTPPGCGSATALSHGVVARKPTPFRGGTLKELIGPKRAARWAAIGQRDGLEGRAEVRGFGGRERGGARPPAVLGQGERPRGPRFRHPDRADHQSLPSRTRRRDVVVVNPRSSRRTRSTLGSEPGLPSQGSTACAPIVRCRRSWMSRTGRVPSRSPSQRLSMVRNRGRTEFRPVRPRNAPPRCWVQRTGMSGQLQNY